MKQVFFSITLFSIFTILPVNIFAQQNPFPDCNFVLEDEGCKSYVGYSEAKVQTIIGEAESFGDYYRYGVHLFYETNSGLKKVTFYGIKPKSQYFQTFSGKPHKNLDWGVSPEEVISKYRQPDSQKTWKLSEYVLTEFYYDKNIVVSFMDNKLSSVELIASKSEMEHNKNSTPKRTPLLETISADLDCKYLLIVENCRDKLFETDVQMFIRQFGPSGEWLGQGFESITFNRYSDRISWITFSQGTLGFKPSADLDWNADIKTTIKILGKPLNRSKYKDGDEYVTYPTSQLQFEKGKLKSIQFNRNETGEELAMESAARKRVENSPETKAKNAANQMEADYEGLLRVIESYNEEGERIIKQNMTLIAMGGQWAKDVQNKLDKVTEKMDRAIYSFVKRYDGQVPDWMIKGIQAKRSGQ